MSDTPKNIGKYEILDVAGKGAMGVVYRAHDPFVDRKVAVKLCTKLEAGASNFAKSELARRLFINEARAAGALDHPNILKIYDAAEDDQGRPYIVMEFIDGARTLRNYTKSSEPLDVETAVEWIRQCAEALGYAHEHGVTHRDIKPANIMLNQADVTKIVDFGIAQRAHAEQTQVGGWFGSPRYMSPEQARDEQITPHSDQFSLGIVLYELLAGQPAFEARGITGLIQKIVSEDPAPLTEVRSDVPTRVAAIVERALQKDPKKRYPDCAHLAEELAEVLKQLRGKSTELPEAEKFRLLKGLDFFKEFSDSQIAEVVRVAEWQRYLEDDVIINQDATDKCLYIIADGAVRVDIDGTRLTVLESGECFGEMAYLTGNKRAAGVCAEAPSLVLRIDEPVKQWASLPCQLRFGKRLQEIVVERLAKTSVRLARQSG